MVKVFIILLGVLAFVQNGFSMQALHTAATGMSTQESNVNTISNNIANVNTIGYKRSRAESEDLLYKTKVLPGSRSSWNSQYNVGVQIGTGSKISAIRKDFTRGSPQITKNPFDFMINGEGFFGIMLSSGELRFTRDGAFNVNAQGELENKHGYKVFPGFSFPSNTLSVNVSENGNVDAYIKGQVGPLNIGEMAVFTFTNPVGLKSTGGNLFQMTSSSGEAIQNIAGENNAGIIMQGTLESSNVNIMIEMTNLIKAQRAYEMNSKVMGVADQMLQTVNNIR